MTGDSINTNIQWLSSVVTLSTGTLLVAGCFHSIVKNLEPAEEGLSVPRLLLGCNLMFIMGALGRNAPTRGEQKQNEVNSN